MLVATFRIDLEGLGLEAAFHDVPEMIVEAERIATHSLEWTMPCLWIAAPDFSVVDRALANDPTIEDIVETEEYTEEKYFNINWTDEIDWAITKFIDKKGAILEARATSDGWRLKMRFVERSQFDAFRGFLKSQGHDFELLELFEPTSPRQTSADITPTQRDALVAAAKLGYFKVPREISARELADELGMSHQSVSEVLRRGTENLVRTTLITRDL